MAKSSDGRLLSVCVGVLFVVSVVAGSGANLQGAAATVAPQPTIATAEDAKPFLGQWTTTFDSPQGPVTFDIDVHMDTGDPGATVSNSIIGDSEVTDVTMSGPAMVLRFAAYVQGMEVPVAISLVPDGETLKADFSFMDGAYATSSVCTRRQ